MALLFLDQNKNRVFEKSIKAIEVLLLSAGLVSTLLMVKSALLPYYSCEIAVFSSLMGFCSSIKCLLSSPFYICIIINFMVVLIAATSTFHNQEQDDDDCHRRNQIKVINFDSEEHDSRVSEVMPPLTEIKKTSVETIKEDEAETTIVKENEGEETMESTWRSITGEGKQEAKKKDLKKCETWDVPQNNNVSEESMTPSLAPKRKELRKSETFNETVSRACRGGLRRDPSMSLEEFNKQVEAFIKKFNDDMKLQRQESDQRFLDMVKSGI